MTASRADTIVLGLGNRQAGDDAIGPIVAQRVAARLPGIKVVEGACDALAIVAAWEGFSSAVIVDAALSGADPGTLHRFEDDTGHAIRPKALARCSSHGGGLVEALGLAEALGRRPPTLVVHAVELDSLVPGHSPSQAVRAAVDALVERIVHEIEAAGEGDAPRPARAAPT